MKLDSTLFLQFVLVLVALGAIIGLVWLPQKARRATSLDPLSIYADPLTIHGYVASIPFFIALYQVFKLLNISIANKAFSQSAVNKLKNIKLVYLSLVGFITACAAIVAAVFQRLFQNAVDIKSENYLTVQQTYLWE